MSNFDQIFRWSAVVAGIANIVVIVQAFNAKEHHSLYLGIVVAIFVLFSLVLIGGFWRLYQLGRNSVRAGKALEALVADKFGEGN